MSQIKNDCADFLFIHVPKFSSYYKPLDEFMFINYIPMGVFALCDILNKKGISSKIKHLGLEYINDKNFSIAEYVKENNIKVVALSLHWHFQSYDVIEVAKRIKEVSKETQIILGGYTASLFSNEIMKNYDHIDFIIAGDGEKGMLDLARLLKEGRNDFQNVANCIYRKNGEIIDNQITYLADYAELGNVDYANLSYLDHYNGYRDYFKIPMYWSLNLSVEENIKKQVSGATSTFPLMVGRGCPVNCSFCGGGRDAQFKICRRTKPIFRPANKVVDTMEQALSYGYESFVVCFDPFPNDESYFVELFQEIRRRKLSCGMGFECWGLPTRKFVDEFEKTFDKRTSYIAISPESYSEKVRKMNKGFFYTNDEMYKIMQYIDELEIPMLIYLTMGLPGESSEDLNDTELMTKDLRAKFKYLMSVIVLPVQLEPASPLFDDPKKYQAVTERTCFKDFYEYHKKPDSNPYSYLGYATESLKEADCDIEKFSQYIFNERCKKFCTFYIKLFGKFDVPALAQVRCKLIHKKWLKMGYGKPPLERRTFK
ncbi:B12-binding domain-containing radical SAM protein [Acetivibrio cellulolyticus]|uniref:B12-binding domain-containing radical SAM protein n=1 Tax=Acetivibrio cellulolyticus TaxID=35830 RepID=UPI0001E2DED2|nr:B12-binding domain-containing radical SAM protein [Acetivibrio cellulolyticus]